MLVAIKLARTWVPLPVIGAFGSLAIIGILMFFQLDKGGEATTMAVIFQVALYLSAIHYSGILLP